MSAAKPPPDAQPQDEGFLQRWSRRKQQEAAADELPPANVEPLAETAGSAPDDEAMPALESLSEDSDYSVFFSPRVSEGLRKAALRKLFHGDAFNTCDGLDDYAEDFTRFTALGDILTADLRHQLAQQAQRLANAPPPEEADLEQPPDEQSLADAQAASNAADDHPEAET
jgi:hypothetical protein